MGGVRMLGSLRDAEDALQETMLAAWRGLGRFEQRASIPHLAVPGRDQMLPASAADRPAPAADGLAAAWARGT